MSRCLMQPTALDALDRGSILIDNEDHRSIPLQHLRSKLTIIQQEPTLFKGTLRYNLSPTGTSALRGTRAEKGEVEYKNASCTDDSLLWGALSRAGLAAKVRAMGGLDADITEAGDNLSAGEKQLLCMSRALLKCNPILVMDEATASVDHETDAAIQEMIKKDFLGNTTVLTVAHRLHTIAFYDSVMVLRGGSMAEHAAPLELLTREGSVLRSLAEESGDYDGLVAIAAKAAAETS